MNWLFSNEVVLNAKLKRTMKNDYKIGDRCQGKYLTSEICLTKIETRRKN